MDGSSRFSVPLHSQFELACDSIYSKFESASTEAEKEDWKALWYEFEAMRFYVCKEPDGCNPSNQVKLPQRLASNSQKLASGPKKKELTLEE